LAAWKERGFYRRLRLPFGQILTKGEIMNLLEVRQQFIEQSGRYDLVTDLYSYVDNGADYYISAAARELDVEIFQVLNAMAVRYEVISPSSTFVSLPRCRTIENVWVIDSNGRSQLNYLSLPELRNLGTSSEGMPKYYAPVNARQVPDMSELSESDQDYIRGLVTTFESSYRGVAISPANETKMAVEVHGNFYSALLKNDDDENYWTSAYPDILIKGAMRELERSYRNRQGAEDLSAAISEQLSKLDMDIAMDQASKTDQMRG